MTIIMIKCFERYYNQSIKWFVIFSYREIRPQTKNVFCDKNEINLLIFLLSSYFNIITPTVYYMCLN